MEKRQRSLNQIQAVLAARIDFDAFLSKFSDRDRNTIARHLATYEEKLGPEAAKRWRHFASLLMTLAPYPAKLAGHQAIQYYVPDGKYRKQAFGLQALDDGSLVVYAANILANAFQLGLLAGSRRSESASPYLIAETAESLVIDELDGQTPDPDPMYKAMTAWNRKAIRITLPLTASPVQIEAVETLCALSAMDWIAESQQV